MSKKNKAVFLDRDGVINRDNVYYTYRLEDFIVNEGIFEALKDFTQKGFTLFVITNQSGIAKGLYGHKEVEIIHQHFSQLCSPHNIEIKEYFYCPHHPDTGNCICRKPDSQLIEKAIALHDIDPSQSWFIGDRERDIQCGAKEGIKGILIEPNASLIPLLKTIV